MEWKSKAEIEAANLADWEKETCIEIFVFERNVAEIAEKIRENAKKESSYNGWTNWDTWEAYNIISNDEKRYNLVLRQLNKTLYLGIRSIKAAIKAHNRELKKEKRTDLTINLDNVNVSEIVEVLKEDLEVN